jgi:RNA polymerase sigma-70 factor (ECF subfamily)
MVPLTDEELLARARGCPDSSGGRDFLDQLFSRYQTKVALWCLRVTGDRQSAADLAQEVLLRAYENLESFRGQAKFSTWLYTVTRNHCLNDASRRVARRERQTDPLEIDIREDDRFDLRLEQKDQIALARKILRETLNDAEQRVLTLHYNDEMPLDAITRLMGLTNSSGAKAYIVSAKRKLATAVSRWRNKEVRRREP